MDSASETAALALSLAAPGGGPARTFQVGAQGAWIGRGRDCEVRIDDPERFVSLKHARIDYAQGQFWLTDQSTNGTFLDDAADPMDGGQRTRLHTGDHFRLGRFVIRVTADGAAAEQGAAPAVASPVSEGRSGEADPLLMFAPSPRVAQPSPPRQQSSPLEPDPLAAFLAGLTTPTGERPRDDPRPKFERVSEPVVGAASAQANREIQAASPALPDSALPARAAADDVLSTMAAEVVALSPALRQPDEPAEPASVNAYPPAVKAPPRPEIDSATAALAAFWFGLGIVPRHLDRDGLVDTMAELGMAFREAAEGFAGLLGHPPFRDVTERNPFGSGHRGLARHLDERPADAMRLNEAVREAFRRNEQRAEAYRAAAREAAEEMARNLSANALEQRFAEVVHGRWPRSRYAQMWRLFRALEKELCEFAEAGFQSEVERRTRGPIALGPPREHSGSAR